MVLKLSLPYSPLDFPQSSPSLRQFLSSEAYDIRGEYGKAGQREIERVNVWNLKEVAAKRANYPLRIPPELKGRPQSCLHQSSAESCQVKGFSFDNFTAIVACKDFSSDGACASGKKGVDEKLFHQVARNVVVNPNSRKTQHRYVGTSDGKPDRYRYAVKDSAANLPQPKSFAA